MPVFFGATISGAVYDDVLLTVTVSGTAFGENEYPVSDILLSTDGATWESVDTIDFWSDDEAVGSVLVPLASGSYYVRVITSDNDIVTSGADEIVVGDAGTLAVMQFFGFAPGASRFGF